MKHQKVSFSGLSACGVKSKSLVDDPVYVSCPTCQKLGQHKEGKTTFYYGFYLVGIDGKGEIRTFDGSHDKESEVQEALELLKRLNLFKPELDYKMAKLMENIEVDVTWKTGHCRGEALWIAKERGLLKLSEVPTRFKVKINEEAASFVGAMVKAVRGA